MAKLTPLSGAIRIDGYRHRVCSILGVAHNVSAQTAANFVSAVETLYNNGDCTARLAITLDIER